MGLVHLYARVQKEIYAYSIARRAWSGIDFPAEIPWPPSVDFCLLTDDPGEVPRWSGSAEGVVHYVDRNWFSIGLICEFRGPDEVPIHVPITFPLCQESRQLLQSRSPDWFQHLHTTCRGTLRQVQGPATLCFVVAELAGTDNERVRQTVLRAIADPAENTAEADWARKAALPLASAFGAAIAADLLEHGDPAEPPSPARTRGIEPLLHHIVGCADCRGRYGCNTARTLLQQTQGSGYSYDRLCRVLTTSPRLAEQSSVPDLPNGEGSPVVFARCSEGVVAGVLPSPRWTYISAGSIPSGWDADSMFAIWQGGVSDSFAVSEDAPVLTYLDLRTGWVGLLLSFRSANGDYHVPLGLQLDRSVRANLGDNPEVWREWSQRSVSGTLIPVGSRGDVRFRLEVAGPVASDRLRSALVEALLDEEPCTLLQAQCRALLIEQLRWYGIGLAFDILGLGRDHQTLRYEATDADLRPFLWHLLRCEDSRVGDPCTICNELITALHPRPNTGLETLGRFLESRFRRETLVGHIKTVISQVPTSQEREAALTQLRRAASESFVDAAPAISVRWPVTIAWRLGAPWSLLAWLSVTRPIDPRQAASGTAGPKRVFDRDVIQHGWDIRKADNITGLLIKTLREEQTTAPQLVLAALAFAEIATRHKQALHPLAVRRVFRALDGLEPESLRNVVRVAANRLVKVLVEAEFYRRDTYSEAATATRAEELWNCLAAMPIGARETRMQWLQVYYMFPWMRPVIEPAVAELDPESPISEAFRWPIPRPPSDLLDSSAAAPVTAEAAIDSARLRLIWHWFWMDTSGNISAVPPVPGLDDSRVDGSLEYLRQFLWGCWRVTGAEAESMWRALLPRVLETPLEPRVENQAWMSVARYRSHVAQSDGGWAAIAHSRLQVVLREATELSTDTRAISLLRLLGTVEKDAEAFASAWLLVESVYDRAGISGERQRCLAFLSARSDLGVLASDPRVRARLNSALLADNTFVQTAALRGLLGGAGIRGAVEWLCRPAVHELLWAGDGALWLQRVAAADLSAWGEWLLALLEHIALGLVPALDRSGELQYRLEAMRSLELLDPEHSIQVAETLLQQRDLDVVRLWLRDQPWHGDHAARIMDDFWRVAAEVGGAGLGKAAELAQQLGARGVHVRPEHWQLLAEAIGSAIPRAVAATDLAWLLAGWAYVPVEYRGPLEMFDTDVRLVLGTPGAATAMGRNITVFLSALAVVEVGAVPDGVSSFTNLVAYVQSCVQVVLESEPNRTVRSLFAWLWTAEQTVAKGPRSRFVMALAGSENQRPPASLLDILVQTTRSVLEIGPGSGEFAAKVTEVRGLLKECEHVIDEAALDLTRELGFHWDDLLLGRHSEVAGIPAVLAELPTEWDHPDQDAFTRVFRVMQLLKLRFALSQCGALLHDVAYSRNTEELARFREQLGAELVRIALPAAQRFEQPWIDIHHAAIDLIKRSGWEGVEVVTAWTDEEIAARREDALRLGARFDLADLTTAVHNLVSNAIQHGDGWVRIVIKSTEVEIRNLQKSPLPLEFWTDLNAWLNNTAADASEPAGVRPRTGLRSVRRSIRRNVALHVDCASKPVNTNSDLWSGDDGPAQMESADHLGVGGMDSVFTISWQTKKTQRIPT
jgi:hypothetical protein